PGNNFVISGRGGLPQNPNGLFSGDTVSVRLVDLVVTEESASKASSENTNSTNIDNLKHQIIEATGWVKDADGNVLFVANLPQKTSQNSAISSASCHQF
ncbi:MAG: filamentous hemagglutinin, partial [Rivularia sp. ALOHA_DT_140]|nr:filamentous hemagglutinin [Rivularia sp. ALOHA_DT_140]